MRIFVALLLLAAAAALATVHIRTLGSPDVVLEDLALRDLRVEGDRDHRVGITLRAARTVGARSGPVRVILKSSWGTREMGPTVLAGGEQRTLTWRSPPVPAGDHLVTAWIRSDDARPDADESNNTRSTLVRVRGRVRERATAIARVPDVVGRSRSVAVALLRRSGFRVGDTYEHGTGERTGLVERQWPEAGGAAPRGTAGTLVMGALTSVPDLSGLSLDQARAVLRRRDLEVGRLQLRNVERSEPIGVLAQSPAPGTRVPLHAGIRLAIAQPAPSWPLPVAAMLAMAGIALFATRPRRREVTPPVFRRSTSAVGPDPNEAPERFMPRPIEPEPTSPMRLVPLIGSNEHASQDSNSEIVTFEAPGPVETWPDLTEPKAGPKDEPFVEEPAFSKFHGPGLVEPEEESGTEPEVEGGIGTPSADAEGETLPDHEIVAPETEILAPETEILAPETEILAPETEIVAPETEILAPETEIVAQDHEILASETEIITPEAEIVVPETEIITPETSTPEPVAEIPREHEIPNTRDAVEATPHPAKHPTVLEPRFERRPIEAPRWEPRWDAGQQNTIWHMETAQPAITFELVPDLSGAGVARSMVQNARSESA